MDFLPKLIVHLVFIAIQLVFVLLAKKALKDKTLAESGKILIQTFIVVPIIFVVSFFLKIVAFFVLTTLLSFISIIISTIATLIGVIYFKKFMELRFKEALHIQEVEAEALKLAEINNITDETYLRAKNLLPLGNDFLILTANAIRKKASRQEVYDFVLEKMISEAFADGGIVLIVDGEDEVLKVKSLMGVFPPPYKLPTDVPLEQKRVETSVKYAQFDFENNLFADIASSGKPLLVKDAEHDSRIFMNGDDFFLKAGTYLFLPFISNGQVIGMAALSRSYGSPSFTESDVEICQILADYSSTSIHIAYSLDEEAEKDSISNEKELATKIQKLLLPEKIPKLSEADVGMYFQPASGICSDYYDVIRPSSDKIFFVMLDVAGKSIQASIIMIMIRTLLNLTTNTNQSAEKILEWINKGVTKKINIDHFASLALIQYDPLNKKLYYAGAGNISVSIFRNGSKKFERIRQTTDAIGIDVDSKYQLAETTVASGDIIILYSDGAIEALNKNGDSFTLERIYELVGLNADSPAKDIINLIKQSYDEFTRNLADHDDRSIMIAKIT